ncbi:MAG: serine hydrolase [Bacteroidetes bacterium]|nr:serine hydrolase [Bacteroidota bacterium]
MKKFSIAFMLLLMTHTSQAQFNTTLANMLQDSFNYYTGVITNIKGLSLAVNVPGQGIWTATSGVSYTGTPFTSDMRMGIASNTKLFVSTIMLKLAEDKILSLDDSLKKWLPTYANVNPNITIRQLLSHRSGLPDPIFVSPWMDTVKKYPSRVFTPTEVIGWLGAPLSAPGASYNYSNVNYILAGMIAKQATGYHISKLIRDSILTPLNMDSTFYDVEEPTNGILAHRWWNLVDYNDTPRVGLNTAGGCAGAMFSTASEMVQWYKALFDKKIIGQASLNEITNFIATGTPGYYYGLGLARETTQTMTYWTHGGDTWGYKSKMIFDSCLHVGVGGFSNSFPSGLDAIVFIMYRIVKLHVPSCGGALAGPTTVCAGTNSVTYTVPAITGATSYVWELPAGVTGTSTTNSITVNFGLTAVSGTITVRSVNNYGAGGYSSLNVVVNPKPATPVVSQAGNILTSNAPTGNQWYNASGMIAGATGSSYNITSSGIYYSIVTLAGCKSDTSNKFNATYNGINTIAGNDEMWMVFPNPATNNMYCRINGVISDDMQLNIYSITGVLVKSEHITQNEQNISCTDLSNGIYVVELRTGKTVERKLLSIQK